MPGHEACLLEKGHGAIDPMRIPWRKIWKCPGANRPRSDRSIFELIMERSFWLFAMLAPAIAQGQQPVWSPDIANILYEHCSACHHDGGIAPFPLMSYDDADQHAWAIAEMVAFRHMPPWPADPAYRHFKDENVLTQAEIDAIVAWVLAERPYGDPGVEPVPPVFAPGGSMLDTIDLQVAIPPYTLQYNTDEYRWFVVENPFDETIYVNAIEVFPGLDDVVHHADISYDDTGSSLANDQADPLPGFNSGTGSPTYSYYMNAWQPGGNIACYPPGWGIAVPPGADLVLEIHYGPGAQGQVDSTVMNLEFVTGGNIRPVSVGWLLGHAHMTDGPLHIPANTVRTFHQERTLTQTASFVSICPHMHNVGRSYKVWFEYQGQSVPLIDIPHWDFHWQKYYTFQQVQVIPAGAVIKSEGVYDNTVSNEHNPNDPPQDVDAGSTTADEMFLTYFIWTGYQPGDEDIVLDSLLLLGAPEAVETGPGIRVWPTLADQHLFIEDPAPDGPLDIMILDALGRNVRPRVRMNGPGPERVFVGDLPSGVYLLAASRGKAMVARRFVRP